MSLLDGRRRAGSTAISAPAPTVQRSERSLCQKMSRIIGASGPRNSRQGLMGARRIVSKSDGLSAVGTSWSLPAGPRPGDRL